MVLRTETRDVRIKMWQILLHTKDETEHFASEVSL